MSHILLLLSLVACSTPPAPSTSTAPAAPSSAAPASAAVTAPLESVSVGDLAALNASDPIVIDVRTDAEWAQGHVPGAMHIPLSELDSRLSELEGYRDEEIYAICQSGGRSARAADLLARNGFRVHNVNGGTGAWIAAGHPTE